MDASSARFNHSLHQLEGIQTAAEAGFRVSDQGREPVGAVVPLGVVNFISSLQRIVDPPHHVGDAIRRIQTLVGIHLPGIVGVCRHLPAADVNRFQPGLHLLDCLVSGHGAERRNMRLVLQQVP